MIAAATVEEDGQMQGAQGLDESVNSKQFEDTPWHAVMNLAAREAKFAAKAAQMANLSRGMQATSAGAAAVKSIQNSLQKWKGKVTLAQKGAAAGLAAYSIRHRGVCV